ncbi:MAG: hypothetical protein QNK37_27775 [Acidobacteriota bacterium]|nr:hypothetical protein [Acidobacteriota bacterium]
MAFDSNIGYQLLDVPFPDLIKSMGLAIAEAQYELDLVGVKIAQLMAGKGDADADPPQTDEDTRFEFGDQSLTLLELGFTPSFYQFVDTLIEVKVSISTSLETTTARKINRRSVSIKGGWFAVAGSLKVNAGSVSASYASKYQYSAEGSSLMRTKLVPVPPPAVLEQRIRGLLSESDTT